MPYPVLIEVRCRAPIDFAGSEKEKKNPKYQTDLTTALIRGFCSMQYNPSLYKLSTGTNVHSYGLLVSCSAGPFPMLSMSRRKSTFSFSICSTASASDHSEEKVLGSKKDNSI